LILKDWSYFDEFVFKDNNPVKFSFFNFPLIEFDLIPLNKLLTEMFNLTPKNARELIQKISFSKLLKIPVSLIPEEKFLLCELFLQNGFFKNSFSVPLNDESEFLPIKRQKINSVKENLCELNFNEVWSKMFNSFNLGFDSLNCDCCKPVSLNDSNILPNSLIEAEFLSDGLFVFSFNPSFASKFHILNPLKNARKKHQLEWGLEFPPLGPFMRAEKALIPFNDALNLFNENKINIDFNLSKINWFCKKNNSFLVNLFIELNEIVSFCEEKISGLKKFFLNSFGLNYEFELNSSSEFVFFEFLRFNSDFLLESIPFHLLSPFSRFYSSNLAESIDSVQNLVLNEFKQNLNEKGAKIVFVSPEKVLAQISAPLSILTDFSLKSGFPRPKIVSEWDSCVI
jgi:hypothetical protein